jgi:hypothetical protein
MADVALAVTMIDVASFRNGLYAGLLVAVIAGVWLATLWQPERQVRLHTEHFLSEIEGNDWRAVADFIGSDYRDQWGNDRGRVLEQMRELFRSLPRERIEASGVQVRTENRQGSWQGKITIRGGSSEFARAIEERVNSLVAPFELEWRQRSKKPWDWTLAGVRNPALEIPNP